MCEERERLIGYVYEECDPDERRTIEAHLESCHVCRNEIGGLRSVRHQLLAWEVPDQPPVWRPVAPTAPVSPWNAVPAWAMTLAAGLLLMVGAAGGAVTYALMPRPVLVASAPEPQERPAASLPADAARMAQFERRIAELERTATPSSQPEAASVNATEMSKMKTTVNSLMRRMDDLDYAVTRTALSAAEVRTDQQRLRNFVNISSAGFPAVGPGVGGAK